MESESTRLAGMSVPDHQGLRAICSLGQMSLLHYVISLRIRNTTCERVWLGEVIVIFRKLIGSTRTRWCECQRGKIRGAALDIYNWEHLPKDSKQRTIDRGKKRSSGSCSIHI